MNSTYKQLEQNLDSLGLTQIKEHLTEMARLVSGNTLSFTDGLLKLTNYEVDRKIENASKSMVKVAAFPFIKELADFDFDFQQGINKQEILELATLRFMENNENIVFLSNSGVGKTHLATSIGIIAAKKRISTYFIKCHDLIQQLKKAKMENRLEAKLKYLNRYKLLIIDELGYISIDESDSNLFFQLIDMRYEKKSTIITTNMNFSNWDTIFNGAIVANAILDRILHHSNVITITGNSYRIKEYVTEDIN